MLFGVFWYAKFNSFHYFFRNIAPFPFGLCDSFAWFHTILKIHNIVCQHWWVSQNFLNCAFLWNKRYLNEFHQLTFCLITFQFSNFVKEYMLNDCIIVVLLYQNWNICKREWCVSTFISLPLRKLLKNYKDFDVMIRRLWGSGAVLSIFFSPCVNHYNYCRFRELLTIPWQS